MIDLIRYAVFMVLIAIGIFAGAIVLGNQIGNQHENYTLPDH